MNSLKFEGKGFEFFKIHFVNVILAILSLTLLYPWAMIRELKYVCQKTFLAGNPFIFTGKVKDFFKGYLKTFLACLFLSAIYAGGMVTSVLHRGSILSAGVLILTCLITILFAFYLQPIILHGSLRFRLDNTSWGEVRPAYKGMLSELVTICFTGSILTTLTAGIYKAWYQVKLTKYLLQHMRFGSLRFDFKGESKELFLIYLKGFFLCLITFGIYGIWFTKKLYEFSVNNTVVKKDDQEFQLYSDANTLEVFEMTVGNFLLIVLTLGIGASWAYMRYYRFLIDHCVIPEDFNISSILDQEKETDLTEKEEIPVKNWLDKWDPQFIA